MRKLISIAKKTALIKVDTNGRLFGQTMTFRYFALLLFIAIGSVQYLNAQDYATVKIEDSRSKPLAVVAGKNYDGHLYHQELGDSNGDNGLWQFISTGDGYYNIINLRNNKAIVAGDSYDGNLYNQDANNRDNAKWKLVKKGDNKFQIIDKKHGKAIVSSDTPDNNLHHQDPGNRSNAVWNITIVGNESGLAPKEIVVKEKFLSIKYDANEKIKDNNSDLKTTNLENEYTNETTREQTHEMTAESKFIDATSWESSEEVSNEIWLSVEASAGYKGLVEASVTVQTGVKQTSTSRKSKSNSTTYENTVGFKTATVIPAGKTTICKQLVTRENASIPYTITVLRTFGDNSTQTMTVPGVWKGAVYSRSKVTCNESASSVPDNNEKPPVTPKTTAEPESAPPSKQTLDASEATSLVEELEQKLPDLDDATGEAITQKWDAHKDLAGKTKSQILQILFKDVKAIVQDKETQEAIWTALNESEEPDSNH